MLTEPDKADHKRRISDHFMVITTVDVRADDDTVAMPRWWPGWRPWYSTRHFPSGDCAESYGCYLTP